MLLRWQSICLCWGIDWEHQKQPYIVLVGLKYNLLLTASKNLKKKWEKWNLTWIRCQRRIPTKFSNQCWIFIVPITDFEIIKVTIVTSFNVKIHEIKANPGSRRLRNQIVTWPSMWIRSRMVWWGYNTISTCKWSTTSWN